MSLISFDRDKCTACGICSKICPVSVLMPGEEEIPSIPEEYELFCNHCGHCMAVCPSNAITPNYQAYPPEDDAANTEQISPEVLTKYVQSRRSIRVFKDKLVEKEKIEGIFEAVRFSPSGMNAQPVKWIVVTDAAEVKKFADLTIDWVRMIEQMDIDHPLKPILPALISLADAGIDPICRCAPCLVYAYSENSFGYTDSIIALTTFDLMAPSFGLGTCWAGLLHVASTGYQPLRDALGIPEGYVPQYPMLLGYPKYKYRKIPGRKKPDIIWK
jgi:nitroreductase/NAD-dependent dihydropyrimidine dehydrogenase PreA subunit